MALLFFCLFHLLGQLATSMCIGRHIKGCLVPLSGNLEYQKPYFLDSGEFCGTNLYLFLHQFLVEVFLVVVQHIMQQNATRLRCILCCFQIT